MARTIQTFTLLGALAIGLQPARAAVVDFRKLDLRPLLTMESTRLTEDDLVSVGGILYGGRLRSDESLTISRGGAVTDESVSQSYELRPFQSRYVRGVASSGAMAALSAALTGAQVGLQSDCSITEPKVLTGHDTITWYGKGTRRNSFRVGYGEEAAGLPACSAQLQQLIKAIKDLREQVRGNPASEVIISK